MSRARMLLIVNPLLLLSILFQAVTGIFSDKLPPDFFERLHTVNGYLLTTLFVAHLALNWNWVTANVFPRKKKAAAKVKAA